MIRYFKKSSPKTTVMLAEGSFLKFTIVDHATGIFATDNEKVQAQIDEAIKAHRGGITEIQHQEFVDLNEKKKREPLKRLWREEFGIHPMQTLMSTMQHGPGQAVVGVADTSRVPVVDKVERPSATKH